MASSYRDEAGSTRIPDASPWKRDGLVHGYVTWEDSPLGRGLTFDGLLTTVAFQGDGVELGMRSFTWELWMKTDMRGAEIFHRGKMESKWDHFERRVFLGIPGVPYASSVGWNPMFLGWGEPNVYAACSVAIDSAEWTHLVLRRTMQKADSGVVEWFVNGAPVGGVSRPHVLEWDKQSDSLYLGVDFPGNARLVRGAMAEFRISRVARSAEWIRMSHYAQGPKNSTWITFQE